MAKQDQSVKAPGRAGIFTVPVLTDPIEQRLAPSLCRSAITMLEG
jgi:hypothetical protein